MNVIIVINCENLNDIPKAINAVGKIVEADISVRGSRANCIGSLGLQDGVRGDFDYQVQPTNFQSIGGFIDSFSSSLAPH